jgi:hypothetical protein
MPKGSRSLARCVARPRDALELWQTMALMRPTNSSARGSNGAPTTRVRNPFIAGNWVRAENFFGREALLSEILEGQRDSLWVAGARRLGKTSVLKELEYRTQQNPQSPFVPLYWDLEGGLDARGLAEGLLSSVEDSEPLRRAIDLTVEDLEGMSVVEMLSTLVRRTVRNGWRLLLLLDEGEEFLTLARQDVGTLLRMRRVFQKGPEVRTILTATRRLARIDEAPEYATSPFLQGFVPPLYLTPLAADEARLLLARGSFSDADCNTILERTGAHPFLVQLIASRLFEVGDLEAVLEQVGVDEMVANFFSVDFQTLEKPERRVLEEVARAEQLTLKQISQTVSIPEEALAPGLVALDRMGYLTLDGDGYRVGNSFFGRWLRRARSLGGAEATL